jgi:hypothetical protein
VTLLVLLAAIGTSSTTANRARQCLTCEKTHSEVRTVPYREDSSKGEAWITRMSLFRDDANLASGGTLLDVTQNVALTQTFHQEYTKIKQEEIMEVQIIKLVK